MLSLELCKALKENGFPQNTEFDLLHVGNDAIGKPFYEIHPKGSVFHEDCVVVAASPTLSELIEECRKVENYWEFTLSHCAMYQHPFVASIIRLNEDSEYLPSIESEGSIPRRSSSKSLFKT